jgi:hypothetical protein
MEAKDMNIHAIILGWIFAMFAAAPLVAAGLQNDPLSASDGSLPQRALSAIRIDVHAALRAEALTRKRGQNTAEVVRLIDLYREMAAHPKRDTSVSLTELGLSVRSRLKKASEEIERQTARSAQAAKKNEVQRARAIPASVMPQTRVLAQQIGVPAGAANAPGAQQAAAQPAAAQAAAATTIDYGPELVELIQATISPATWDINGGNGSVVYFAPLRVLVVSAPGTVHNQIGGVLGQLRAAP